MNLSFLPTIGFLELCLVALLVTGIAFALFRNRLITRWVIVGAISFIGAALLSPADLFSTLILAAMFFGMALLGSRIGGAPRGASS